MIGRVEESSGGHLRLISGVEESAGVICVGSGEWRNHQAGGICVGSGEWRNHQGASAFDREGGGIIRGHLRVIGRVEELSGGRLCVIVRVEESSGGVCVGLGGWRNHQGASACDGEGGGISWGRLFVIGRVEKHRRASVIGRMEESS